MCGYSDFGWEKEGVTDTTTLRRLGVDFVKRILSNHNKRFHENHDPLIRLCIVHFNFIQMRKRYTIFKREKMADYYLNSLS